METGDNKLINKYTDLGINPYKIIVTPEPSVCIWSLTRKCLVGGKNQPPSLEVVDGKITYENNRMVSLLVREGNDGLDIDEINNSEGIIVTDATYGRDDHYRFNFIPTK